jgi:hypothetical protein
VRPPASFPPRRLRRERQPLRCWCLHQPLPRALKARRRPRTAEPVRAPSAQRVGNALFLSSSKPPLALSRRARMRSAAWSALGTQQHSFPWAKAQHSRHSADVDIRCCALGATLPCLATRAVHNLCHALPPTGRCAVGLLAPPVLSQDGPPTPHLAALDELLPLRRGAAQRTNLNKRMPDITNQTLVLLCRDRGTFPINGKLPAAGLESAMGGGAHACVGTRILRLPDACHR